METFSILVCGGRDYGDRIKLFRVLDEISKDRSVKIISGAARGADRLSVEWAKSRGVPFLEFPADWSRYGRSAGVIRNQQMLDEALPDLVLAFPGGTGTMDMVKRARRAGVDTRLVE